MSSQHRCAVSSQNRNSGFARYPYFLQRELCFIACYRNIKCYKQFPSRWLVSRPDRALWLADPVSRPDPGEIPRCWLPGFCWYNAKLDFFLNELNTPSEISFLIPARELIFCFTDLLEKLIFGITDNNGNCEDFLRGTASGRVLRIWLLHLSITHLSNSYGQRELREARGQHVEVACGPCHPIPNVDIIIIIIVIIGNPYQERLAWPERKLSFASLILAFISSSSWNSILFPVHVKFVT